MSACRTVGCSQGHGPHERHDDLLLSGGWDGHTGAPAQVETTDSAALADLRLQVRSAYLDAIAHRDRASKGTDAESRVRAVAWQASASRLLRILDTQRTDGRAA